MDKGFELMIPRKKEDKKKHDFNHEIKFKIFNKEFYLQFRVK